MGYLYTLYTIKSVYIEFLQLIKNRLSAKSVLTEAVYNEALLYFIDPDMNCVEFITNSIATPHSNYSRTHIDDHNKGFYELKKKKDMLQSERNDLCRKEMNLQQSLSALKEELAKAEQTLRSMAGKPILNGRDSVKKVLEIMRSKGKNL